MSQARLKPFPVIDHQVVAPNLLFQETKFALTRKKAAGRPAFATIVGWWSDDMRYAEMRSAPEQVGYSLPAGMDRQNACVSRIDIAVYDQPVAPPAWHYSSVTRDLIVLAYPSDSFGGVDKSAAGHFVTHSGSCSHYSLSDRAHQAVILDDATDAAISAITASVRLPARHPGNPRARKSDQFFIGYRVTTISDVPSP